jgi:hypothetical protein
LFIARYIHIGNRRWWKQRLEKMKLCCPSAVKQPVSFVNSLRRPNPGISYTFSGSGEKKRPICNG